MAASNGPASAELCFRIKDLQQSLQERMDVDVAQKATWDETMEGWEGWSECGSFPWLLVTYPPGNED